MVTKEFTYTVVPFSQTKTKSFSYFIFDPNTGVSKPFTYQVVEQGSTSTKPFLYTITTNGPTVVAGPNRTVDAFEQFTLVPQTKTAGAAAVVSESWSVGATVVSNTGSVTLVGPITANGTSIVYTYKATDANGASASSSLTVSVRPSNLRTGSGRPLVETTGP